MQHIMCLVIKTVVNIVSTFQKLKNNLTQNQTPQKAV